jgi:hypothetical protein
MALSVKSKPAVKTPKILNTSEWKTERKMELFFIDFFPVDRK